MSKVFLEKIPIKVKFQGIEVSGELIRFLAPRTIESLVRAVPFSSKAFLWKEELYFETPVSLGPERPKPTVQPGDIAYWPPGKALCLFFGSSQPYSPVNVIGKLKSELSELKKVRNGEHVEVKIAE